MNVLIYTQSYYMRNTFVTGLIPRGISLYHVEHSEGFMEKVAYNRPDIIVMDVIREDYDSAFAMVKEIKNHPDDSIKKTGVILLIGPIDKIYITAAIQIGVIGFIKSNATEDFIAEYIFEMYKKIKGVPPERKFARVSIDTSNANERVGLKFRSPVNSQLIIGLIKDISFGGIAVELVGTFPEESLAVGLQVRNMQFILDGKDVLQDSLVVAFQKKFCAFRFIEMSNQNRDIIAHYIFQRMSSLISSGLAEHQQAAEANAASVSPTDALQASQPDLPLQTPKE